MSKLTDKFIQDLINQGKSEEEASLILSDLITQSLNELYQAKNLDEKASQALENRLQKLLEQNASEKELFQTIGITPDHLHEKLKIKISQYQSNLKKYEN